MNRSVFLAGLPGAGKSTFLAALWQLIFSQGNDTALKYAGLSGVEVSHLNALQRLWLEGKPIPRTKPATEKVAEINLLDAAGKTSRLQLPDYAGESFRQIWQQRLCPEHVAKAADEAAGLFLLVNVDRIVLPRLVHQQARDVGASQPLAGALPFDPKRSPTATMMTDVLQFLLRDRRGTAPKKVALGLTAWDTVEADQITPVELLADRLPLFFQFIKSRIEPGALKVFGISAQGGDYKTQREDILQQRPLDRIRVYEAGRQSHDLTEPVSWLLN